MEVHSIPASLISNLNCFGAYGKILCGSSPSSTSVISCVSKEDRIHRFRIEN